MTAPSLCAAGQLWQIGVADDKSDEFVDYRAAARKIEVAPGHGTSSTAAAARKGLHGVEHPQLEIGYSLDVLPPHGVMFSFKRLQATKNGPQVALFSNGLMAGLVQLWGTAETGSPHAWKKTYQLYIPRELLVVGHNVLTLKSCRPMWSGASVDGRLWWQWDYLRLETLASPAREPIHGTVAYLGTTSSIAPTTAGRSRTSIRRPGRTTGIRRRTAHGSLPPNPRPGL